MLRSAREVSGYRIQATDEEVGHVEDFVFDDVTWTVRYLVVETGNWLQQRQVLLPPHTLQEPSWMAGVLPVQLSSEQIRQSPAMDETEPFSRDYERTLHGHYGWDYYWLNLQSPVQAEQMDVASGREQRGPDEMRLRRAAEIYEYAVYAEEEKAGSVQDLLLDDEQWMIRYVVVETGSWLAGRKVLVATAWIQQVDWTHNKLTLNLPRDLIEDSPEYDESAPVDRNYEETLHDYYARPKYWI
jgi:sporulation protein YlmC with PRC-barrel domain